MTRDEAVSILREATADRRNGGMVVLHSDDLHRWITAFEKLGMLKIEEPLSERERIREALQHMASVTVTNLLDPDVFYAVIRRAGLELK